MGFLQPLALFGLAAAVIPALLHLMTRRQPPTVLFPAVRYIEETERVHSRRLKLRNLLLLILRTLLIVFAILAASRPVLNLGAGSGHPPTAVGMVLDNSMSSGLVIDGRSLLDVMRGEAHRVIDGLSGDDRLWLVTADGVPQAMGKVEAAALVDTLATGWGRLDLGEAVRALSRTLERAGMPNTEVVVLSDLQRTALSSGASLDSRVVFWKAPDPPENHGIDSVVTARRPSGNRWRVAAWVGGRGSEPIAARFAVGGQPIARSIVRPGEQVVFEGLIDRREPGWSVGQLSLDPDELRADDMRYVAVLVAPPAKVDVTASLGAFLDHSLAVLMDAGRITSGSGVAMGVLAGSGVSIVFPPEDAVLVGATNRSLERAGSSLRFGDRLTGEWMLAGEIHELRGVSVTQHQEILGSGAVLATVGSAPWLVRDGNILLVGSRATPGWSDLPLRADFIPFIDLLVNSLAPDGATHLSVTPGSPFEVPAGIAALVSESVQMTVRSGARALAPTVPGVYFMIGDQGDTLGAVTVTHDPRESQLDQATLPMLTASFGAGVVAPTSDLQGVLFNGGGRVDLTTLLIALALVTALVELWVATSGGGRKGRRADGAQNTLTGITR